MSKYFYAVNTSKIGPLSLEQLKNVNISGSTLVWKDGMTEWKRADTFEELKGFVNVSPPQLPLVEKMSYKEYQKRYIKPESNLTFAIISTIFCIPFGIISIYFALRVEKQYYARDYQKSLNSSHLARNWAIIGCVIGGLRLISFVLCLLIPYLFENYLNDFLLQNIP